MDLRTRSGLIQRIAEGVIRFRLPLLIVSLGLWLLFAAAWRESVGVLLAQAERNGTILASLLKGEVGNLLDWVRFGFAVALLFLFRSRLIGWKAGLSTLYFLGAVVLGCWLLDGSEPILPVILGAISLTLVTLFFFGKSAWLIGALPYALAIYALESWIPGIIQRRGMGWQVVLALASADLFLQLLSIRVHMKAGHVKSGSVVHGVISVFPGVVGTAILLFVVDVGCFFLGMPTLQGGTILDSLLVYLAYMVVVIGVAPALFSLSPFGRIKSKSRSVSRP
jgi:hypothetical protein